MADEESVRKVRRLENGEANGGNNTIRDPMDNDCESKFNSTLSFDAKPEGMDRGRQLSEGGVVGRARFRNQNRSRSHSASSTDSFGSTHSSYILYVKDYNPFNCPLFVIPQYPVSTILEFV
ncbi:hypothetical protein NPIL_384071 [Nephila pilipes]|uniref:Uncharacterized protein n=1 Tax=Nephila pilipes TaxID=299642 RepID=A0A8X6TLI0_NEPPI|nr:hypothetical protein NPIL_384071 [Nephila pilipes]